MKSKNLLFCAAALVFSAVSAGDFVANPQRAYNVTWKKHFQNGRDFWLILTPNWHSLKGVSNEEFVKNSATSTWLFFEGSNHVVCHFIYYMHRTGAGVQYNVVAVQFILVYHFI